MQVKASAAMYYYFGPAPCLPLTYLQLRGDRHQCRSFADDKGQRILKRLQFLVAIRAPLPPVKDKQHRTLCQTAFQVEDRSILILCDKIRSCGIRLQPITGKNAFLIIDMQ
jgi:hypothetical protein